MIKRALTASCIAAMAASYIYAAGPWVRGYVVGFYDPAFNLMLHFETGKPVAEAAKPGLPAKVEEAPPPAAAESEAAPAPQERPAAEIVTLDKFRKR